MREALLERIGLRGKTPELLRPAIEGDERRMMRGTPGHRIEHRRHVRVERELATGRASDLHQDDDRERLTVAIVQRHVLVDAIIAQTEILRLQILNKLSGRRAHQRRDNHQVRVGGNGGWSIGLRCRNTLAVDSRRQHQARENPANVHGTLRCF